LTLFSVFFFHLHRVSNFELNVDLRIRFSGNCFERNRETDLCVKTFFFILSTYFLNWKTINLDWTIKFVFNKFNYISNSIRQSLCFAALLSVRESFFYFEGKLKLENVSFNDFIFLALNCIAEQMRGRRRVRHLFGGFKFFKNWNVGKRQGEKKHKN
jgi:hypothetical protein